jgi:hypothetical protein
MHGSAERETLQEGVIVHGALVRQDSRGSWWALGDNRRVMFATESDDLLIQIAQARNLDHSLERLRQDLAQAIATAGRQREEEELLRVRTAEGR